MCRDKLILELCLIQYSIKQYHLIFKLSSILLILLDNPILPESDSQIYVFVIAK